MRRKTEKLAKARSTANSARLRANRVLKSAELRDTKFSIAMAALNEIAEEPNRIGLRADGMHDAHKAWHLAQKAVDKIGRLK